MSQSDGPWTVERVLIWTRGYFERRAIDSPRLSAELILAHVLQTDRIRLYTNYQQELSQEQLTNIRELVKRVGESEPIAYVTGRAHFYNLQFDVSSSVLIPRPDTETLVEQILNLFKHTPGFESPRLLELCTGSGCVAIAVAKYNPAVQIVATDISPAAVLVAQQNVDNHGLGERITLLTGDLFAALDSFVDSELFDVIAANPPYIATKLLATLPANVARYEPHLALDGGEDGLDPHRRILSGSHAKLRVGGRLFLEIAYDQADAAVAAAETVGGYDQIRIVRDYSGHPRVLSVRREET